MHEWKADLEIDEHTATKIIRRQFADLAESRAQRLAAGWDNVVFCVGDDRLFRFPRRAIAVGPLQQEIACLPTIATKLPVPIPFPSHVGTPDESFPWPFFGFRRVPGNESCDVDLDHVQRAAFAKSVALFLRRLHSPEMLHEVGARLPVDPLRRLDLAKREASCGEKLERLANDGLAIDVTTLKAILREAAQVPAPPPTSVVHGDLHFRHTLVDTNGALTGVIDWGDMHRGDPAVDLQWLWGFLPREAHADFFAEYGAITAAQRTLSLGVAVYINAALLDYGTTEGLGTVAAEATRALRLVASVAR